MRKVKSLLPNFSTAECKCRRAMFQVLIHDVQDVYTIVTKEMMISVGISV